MEKVCGRSSFTVLPKGICYCIPWELLVQIGKMVANRRTWQDSVKEKVEAASLQANRDSHKLALGTGLL